MKFLFHVFLLCTISCPALTQENCNFNTYQKKGSNYVFSTYFEGDMKTPLEGICESFIEGRLYERREFKNGKLISEEANFQDGKPRVIFKRFSNRSDHLIAELKTFWENGQPAMFATYYLDETGRRCMLQTDYHLNGNKRFVQSFAFVRLSELNEYELKNHPPHTVDDEGYTYLLVPFGEEETYSTEGKLLSRTRHQLILSDFSKDASKDGLFEEFYENGQLKTKGYYKNGIPDGKWIGYNYWGKKNAEFAYKDNLIQGFHRTWFDNGQLHTEDFYDPTSNHPFNPSKKEWTENGQFLQLLTLDKNGNGRIQKWNEQGVLLYETDIVNNDYQKAIEKEWYVNGQLKSINNHLPTADTTYQLFQQNGQRLKLYVQTIKDGNQLVKNQKEWFENGKLAVEVSIEEKEFVTVTTIQNYYSNGNLKSLRMYKNKEEFEELYASNGIKIRSLQRVDGKLEGPYLECDSLGNVLVHYSYKNGFRDGLCQRVDATSKEVFSQSYANGCPLIGKNDIHSNRKLSERSESESSYIYGLVHRQFFSSMNLHYSSQYIDSLAQCYANIMDSKLYPSFDFPSIDVGQQFLQVRFPISAFPGLLEGDTINPRNKEFFDGLQKLNVPVPTWTVVNGEYQAKIFLDGLYSQAIFAGYFPFLQSWMEFGYTAGNPRMGEDFNHKYHRPNSIFISRENDCIMKASMIIPAGNVLLYIYSNGEVEVENQRLTNEDLLKNNETYIHEIGWD